MLDWFSFLCLHWMAPKKSYFLFFRFQKRKKEREKSPSFWSNELCDHCFFYLKGKKGVVERKKKRQKERNCFFCIHFEDEVLIASRNYHKRSCSLKVVSRDKKKNLSLPRKFKRGSNALTSVRVFFLSENRKWGAQEIGLSEKKIELV